MADPLPSRVIPRTGTALSMLSFGAAGLGNLYRAITDERARATVDAAWDGGIRSFDVAPHYGLGLAERRLGAALCARPRAQFTLSTKVGRMLVPDAGAGRDTAAGFDVSLPLRRQLDYSADGVRRSLADSLERLGLDRIDIAYVHDPDLTADLAEQVERETLPTLCQLRDQGMLRAVGVGINQWELAARLVQSTDLDIVLLAGRYTLLEQQSLPGLLDLCARRNVAVVAGAAFNSGLLATDEPPEDARWNYEPVPATVLARARAIAAVCTDIGVRLPAAALQFPLGHPAVVSVLVGMSSREEVRADLAFWRDTVPPRLWDRLREGGLLTPEVPTP